jgi:hypothetical protein
MNLQKTGGGLPIYFHNRPVSFMLLEQKYGRNNKYARKIKLIISKVSQWLSDVQILSFDYITVD